MPAVSTPGSGRRTRTLSPDLNRSIGLSGSRAPAARRPSIAFAFARDASVAPHHVGRAVVDRSGSDVRM
ncbi:hypothetical protein BSFP_063090 [Burkholderia stabilis]|uniref:Uncharacterized protein n=1 Tax=Burkholderia stabilis TaxID=95485 RepID=A0A1Y1BWE0_9BURK|nr:hypothetical protein BSFP_063090 [Burkholderia stabilis]